jgi:hypothetical protein
MADLNNDDVDVDEVSYGQGDDGDEKEAGEGSGDAEESGDGEVAAEASAEGEESGDAESGSGQGSDGEDADGAAPMAVDATEEAAAPTEAAPVDGPVAPPAADQPPVEEIYDYAATVISMVRVVGLAIKRFGRPNQNPDPEAPMPVLHPKLLVASVMWGAQKMLTNQIKTKLTPEMAACCTHFGKYLLLSVMNTKAVAVCLSEPLHNLTLLQVCNRASRTGKAAEAKEFDTATAKNPIPLSVIKWCSEREDAPESQLPLIIGYRQMLQHAQDLLGGDVPAEEADDRVIQLWDRLQALCQDSVLTALMIKHLIPLVSKDKKISIPGIGAVASAYVNKTRTPAGLASMIDEPEPVELLTGVQFMKLCAAHREILKKQQESKLVAAANKKQSEAAGEGSAGRKKSSKSSSKKQDKRTKKDKKKHDKKSKKDKKHDKKRTANSASTADGEGSASASSSSSSSAHHEMPAEAVVAASKPMPSVKPFQLVPTAPSAEQKIFNDRVLDIIKDQLDALHKMLGKRRRGDDSDSGDDRASKRQHA